MPSVAKGAVAATAPAPSQPPRPASASEYTAAPDPRPADLPPPASPADAACAALAHVASWLDAVPAEGDMAPVWAATGRLERSCLDLQGAISRLQARIDAARDARLLVRQRR